MSNTRCKNRGTTVRPKRNLEYTLYSDKAEKVFIDWYFELSKRK
jgi:hypothetical protein